MTDQGVQLTLTLPDQLHGRLRAAAAASGETEAEYAITILKKALAGPGRPSLRRASTKKLHITTPLIGLVEGLLFGDATVVSHKLGCSPMCMAA
jgi:hypothetical protein